MTPEAASGMQGYRPTGPATGGAGGGVAATDAARYMAEGKYAQAFALYALDAELAEQRGDGAAASDAWSEAGRAALRGMDADRAAASFRRALIALPAHTPDRPACVARIYSQLAAAAYRGCWMLVARDAAALAYRLGQRSGDPARMGKALYNLALAERYLGPGHWDAARDHLMLAHETLARPAPGSEAAFALHALGWLQIDRGDLAEAERTLTAARAALRAAGQPAAIVEVEMVRLLARRGAYREALRRGRALLDHGELQWRVHPTGHLSALGAYAWACASSDPDEALAVTRRALVLALSVGFCPDVLDLLPMVQQLCAITGQPVRASEREALAKVWRRCYARRADTPSVMWKGVRGRGDVAEGDRDLARSGGAGGLRPGSRSRAGEPAGDLFGGSGDPGLDRQGADGEAARGAAGAPVRRSGSGRHVEVQAPAEPVLVMNPMEPGVVTYAGARVALTHHEYGLLTVLAESPGVCQSYGRILTQVWGAQGNDTLLWLGGLYQAKSRLVRKLREKWPDGPTPIQSRPRRGLVLTLAPEAVLRLPQLPHLPLRPPGASKPAQ